MKEEGGYFYNKRDGFIKDSKAVVPLMSTDDNGKIFFIGSCFHISPHGILMTAKHNLFKKDGSIYQNLTILHFLPNNRYISVPIRKATTSNDYDLAILLQEQVLDAQKNKVICPGLLLTNYTPQIEETVCTFGFPNAITGLFQGEHTIQLIPKFYNGIINEYHSNGFSLLKNPCFQTTIRIDSGASGGPVFDRYGRVFAICSTGYDLFDGGENISFVTPILPCLNMKLTDGQGNKMTIQELINNKMIFFENGKR